MSIDRERQQRLELYTQLIRVSVSGLLESADQYHAEANMAEGKMQSRYDTTREELSGVANALTVMTMHRTESISRTPIINEGSAEVVSIGTVVAVIEESPISEEELFLLLPATLEGNHIFEFEGKTVTGLNVSTPLGEALLKSQPGDRVSYKVKGDEFEFRVLKIY